MRKQIDYSHGATEFTKKKAERLNHKLSQINAEVKSNGKKKRSESHTKPQRSLRKRNLKNKR